MLDWFAAANLTAQPTLHLPGQPLTVSVWSADRPGDRAAERAGALPATIGQPARHSEIVR